jgi:hypothetical protein
MTNEVQNYLGYKTQRIRTFKFEQQVELYGTNFALEEVTRIE